MATQTAGSQPFAKGSIIWEKKGPLPVWAWALIVLGLVLGVTVWRNNKNSSAATTAATGTTPTTDTGLGNQSAGPIFIVPGAATPAVNVTVPTAPPGAGRPCPPVAPPPVPGPSTPATVSGFRDTGRIWTDALELHWDPVPGATTYLIRDPYSPNSAPADVGNVTGTMKRGLIHNGSYFWQIAARNAAGIVGPWSPTLASHTKN